MTHPTDEGTTMTTIPMACDIATDQTALADALRDIAPAVLNRTGALPALSHVRIASDDAWHGVRVTATDLDVTVSVLVADAVGDIAPILVPYAQLKKFAASTPKGALVTITHDGAPVLGTAVLAADGIRYSLPTGDRDGWPRDSIVCDRKVILQLDAIADVLPAASDDGARPILNAVHVTSDGTYVATDSYRMYLCATGVTTDSETPMLIGAGAARILCQHAKRRPGMRYHAWRNGTTLQVTWDDGSHVTSRLTEGQFPDYGSILRPATEEHTIRFDRASMLAGLVKVDKLRGKDTTTVRIAGTADTLTLTLSEQDVASVAVDVTGGTTAPFTIGANITYLRELVANTEGADHLALVDTLKPMIARSVLGETGWQQTRVLMPVRIT